MFIPGYANIVRPINNLLKTDVPFEWTDIHTAVSRVDWRVVRVVFEMTTPKLRSGSFTRKTRKPYRMEVDRMLVLSRDKSIY